MTLNPVFVNELRQSPLRRRPLQALAIWAGATIFLMWIAQFAGSVPYALSWLPMFALPIIVPSFAAGTFAKEYEQQTWQDLYLTRLTNAQVVFGKFWAALLQVWVIILACVPAMMLLLVGEGRAWAYVPGWWTVVLLFKLFLSVSLYVLLSMVCSRYSSNRRTALVWSYIALFLYALLGAAIWMTLGESVERANYAATYDVTYAYANGVRQAPREDPVSPGFMQGIHLVFCSVVGIGGMALIWVSMSEQRGYKDSGETAHRAWQPLSSGRSSDPSA